jgi:hypothetical protein
MPNVYVPTQHFDKLAGRVNPLLDMFYYGLFSRARMDREAK